MPPLPDDLTRKGPFASRTNDADAEEVLLEFLAELARAETVFPDQHLPDGTGGPLAVAVGNLLKALCQANGGPEGDTAGRSWMTVVAEEVGESFAETEWPKLRAELVQVGAMVLRWLLDGDSREHRCGEVGTRFTEDPEGEPIFTDPCALRYDHEEPHDWAQREAAHEAAMDYLAGTADLWFDKAAGIPCQLKKEIHGSHGDCPGIDDPDAPAPDMRYPTKRPFWLGEFQPYPCGRCGREVDDSDQHDCQKINKDGSGATVGEPFPLAGLPTLDEFNAQRAALDRVNAVQGIVPTSWLKGWGR